ncbi:Mitochondrial protein Pet127 [Phaffia rhodozyma]|uniref:Mitochondrial protein Pet127 n=1 Tax=Phaffia rhodozyma TaxID=264483 RepID=A0A0F7SNJ4_PHARH|nr:Mitochondrial protein Pet127 [Phaffia rhodozyma]
MLLRPCFARPYWVINRSPIIFPLARPASISIPSVQATSSLSSKAQENAESGINAQPDHPPSQESKLSSIDGFSPTSSSSELVRIKPTKEYHRAQNEECNGSQKTNDAVSTSIPTPTPTTTDTFTSTPLLTSPSTTIDGPTDAPVIKTTSQTIEVVQSIVSMPSASSDEKNTALRKSLKTLQKHHQFSAKAVNAENSTPSSSKAPRCLMSGQRSLGPNPKKNTSRSRFKTTSEDWAFLQDAFLRKSAGPSTQRQGYVTNSRTATLTKALPNQRKTDRWPKKKLDTMVKAKNRGLKPLWTKAKKRAATKEGIMDPDKFFVKPKKVNPRKVFGWEALWEETWDGEKAVQDVTLLPPQSGQAPVPGLEHEFDKALFKPGVHFYQDPKTNNYNFDKRAQAIAHPDEFDLARISKYVTASKDLSLAKLASDNECTFFGSTSSITASLSQIFFALSNNRPVDTSSLSYHFFGLPITTSYSATVPCSIFLRYNEKTGTYGIDGDKTMEHVGQPTHLMDLGHVMEKMLTTTVEDVRRYRKDASEDAISTEERDRRETYHYSKGPDIVMRSQLDGYDPRLPGTGIFDIKTRATASIRHDIENIEGGKHYEINSDVGLFESFERERYDMMRSAFLKYNFQGRIGGMSGMFVAYHNTANIQGLEYFPLSQLDKYLFGSTRMGDQAYSMCVKAFSRLLKQATEQFPKQTLHLTLSAKDLHEPNSMMTVVKPVDPSGVVSNTQIVGLKLSFFSTVQDKPVESGVDLGPEGALSWKVLTKIERSSPTYDANLILMAKMMRKDQEELGSSVVLPPHMTKQEMQDVFAARWEKVKAAEEGRSTAATVEAERNGLDNDLNKEDPPETESASSSEILTSTSASTPTSTLTDKDRPPHLDERPPRLRFRPASQLVTILRALSERARLRALSSSSPSSSASVPVSEPIRSKLKNRHLDKRSLLLLSVEQQAARRSKAARKYERRQQKKAKAFRLAVEARAEPATEAETKAVEVAAA